MPKNSTGLSDAEDWMDTGITAIDDIVEQILAKLKKKADRKAFLIKIEEYCVNHPDSR